MVLTATIDGVTINTALILNLPPKNGDAPKFKNDFYTAEYKKNAAVNDELDIHEAISFANVDNENVDISLVGKLNT